MRKTFQDELLQGLDEEEDKKSQFDVGSESEEVPAPERPLIEDELPEEVDIPEFTPAQPLIEEELPEEPESKMQRYSGLLQRAASAGPSQEDYRRAAFQRAFAEMGTGTPGYFQQMGSTLTYTPDYSWLQKEKDAALRGEDYGIKAKEAEQKGLEGQAEALRKELLLPAEMADRESKALAVQAKLEQLKPASAEEIAAAEEALGTKIPPNITKADLAKMTGQATTQAIKSKGTPLSDTARKVMEKSLSEKAGEAISLEGISKEEADTLNRAFSQGRDKGMTEYQKLRLEQSQANIDLQKSKEESRKEQRDEGKTAQFSNFMGKERKRFADETKAHRTQLDNADLIAGMADTDNWAQYAAVAARMAKAIGGDSGVLTDKDIARYSDSPQLVRNFIDKVKRLGTGTPSKATRDDFVKAAKDVGNMLRKKIGEKQLKAKESIKNDRLFKALEGTDEEIDRQIFGGELLYKDQETPAPASAAEVPAGDRVRVRDVRTGKTGQTSRKSFEEDQKKPEGQRKYELIQ